MSKATREGGQTRPGGPGLQNAAQQVGGRGLSPSRRRRTHLGCPQGPPSRLPVNQAGPRPPLRAPCVCACVPRAPKVCQKFPMGGVSGPRVCGGPGCGRHERGPRGATGPRGRERAAAASSSLAPARCGGASPARSGFKRRHPTPRRTRRSGAARACRCHASARAACARAPATAPGRRRRCRGRGGPPRARAPAAGAAPLPLAAAADRVARRLPRAVAARRLHQPLGSASAGRLGRGGPRGRGARLPQLGPGECDRPCAPKTFRVTWAGVPGARPARWGWPRHRVGSHSGARRAGRWAGTTRWPVPMPTQGGRAEGSSPGGVAGADTCLAGPKWEP